MHILDNNLAMLQLYILIDNCTLIVRRTVSLFLMVNEVKRLLQLDVAFYSNGSSQELSTLKFMLLIIF